jgi:methylmalonyl-CoA/ethylmalonyl-CoA epimerase
MLGLEWDGVIVHDPLQMVRVTFLPLNDPAAATIELIEPAGPRSPVLKFAQSGGGLHHVCYEVDDLDERISQSKKSGCTLTRFPMRAAAFDGRKIAWIQTPSHQLIEFLQK